MYLITSLKTAGFPPTLPQLRFREPLQWPCLSHQNGCGHAIFMLI